MSEEMKAPDLTTDPKAQTFLEGFVKQEILVILIHMPSRMSTSKHLELRAVRAWCEAAIKGFNDSLAARTGVAGAEHPSSEFIVVEIRKSGAVRTTTLEEWRSDPLLDKASAS